MSPFGGRSGRGGFPMRFIIAGVIALFTLFTYFSRSSYNHVTGEKQRVAGMTPDQEIAIGLQAAPTMAQQHGGLHQDRELQAKIDDIGRRLVERTSAREAPYKFEFHLLADPETVNAFALPGGQIFMTYGLMRKLSTNGQIAGVLAHEIGHVVGRHGAEHLAKSRLTQGLVGAAAVASYDPQDGSGRNAALIAAAVGQLVNLKYGRNDELESDRLGVRFMSEAGYDPRAMLRVMEVLRDAGGRGRQPEFMATHPNPENRLGRIEEAIRAQFPDGLPRDLEA